MTIAHVNTEDKTTVAFRDTGFNHKFLITLFFIASQGRSQFV